MHEKPLQAGRTQNRNHFPRVYCGGIEATGGATLNLDPGSYILDRGNFAVGSNSTVSGTDVTIILTSRTGSNTA